MSSSPTPSEIQVGPHRVGGGRPLLLIAGPCVIEEEEATLRVAEGLARACASLGMPLVFKASFDKANRSSIDGFRGPGLERGLEVLARVKRELGLPLTTDVHEPAQAAAVAQVADLLQVPAFLCRQTDLIAACGATGRPVNVKKGQFMAPLDMANAVEKLRRSGAGGAMLTERGSSFGYNNLVVDMRGLALMRELGVPVCMDATHAVQLPGGEGTRSGGERRFAPLLARAAVAAGVDALFLEVHEAPERALSDRATQLPLGEIPALLALVNRIDRIVKESLHP